MPTQKLTPELTEQFKSQFKRVKVVDLDVESLDQTFVLRPPNIAEYKMFKDTARRGEETKAIERLAMQCVVFPDRERLQEVLADFPGVVDSLAKPLAELSGIGEAIEKKTA